MTEIVTVGAPAITGLEHQIVIELWKGDDLLIAFNLPRPTPVPRCVLFAGETYVYGDRIRRRQARSVWRYAHTPHLVIRETPSLRSPGT